MDWMLGKLDKELLKVYVDGKFIGEAGPNDGFSFSQSLTWGTHLLEVVRWEEGEKDRRKFPLALNDAGVYEVRFNYVRDSQGLFSKETMKGSTIDILRQPISAPSQVQSLPGQKQKDAELFLGLAQANFDQGRNDTVELDVAIAAFKEALRSEPADGHLQQRLAKATRLLEAATARLAPKSPPIVAPVSQLVSTNVTPALSPSASSSAVLVHNVQPSSNPRAESPTAKIPMPGSGTLRVEGGPELRFTDAVTKALTFTNWKLSEGVPTAIVAYFGGIDLEPKVDASDVKCAAYDRVGTKLIEYRPDMPVLQKGEKGDFSLDPLYRRLTEGQLGRIAWIQIHVVDIFPRVKCPICNQNVDFVENTNLVSYCQKLWMSER